MKRYNIVTPYPVGTEGVKLTAHLHGVPVLGVCGAVYLRGVVLNSARDSSSYFSSMLLLGSYQEMWFWCDMWQAEEKRN
jgi:hypothetical protein